MVTLGAARWGRANRWEGPWTTTPASACGLGELDTDNLRGPHHQVSKFVTIDEAHNLRM